MSLYRSTSGWVVAIWWRDRTKRRADGGQRIRFCDEMGFRFDEMHVFKTEDEARQWARFVRTYEDDFGFDDAIVVRVLRVRSFADAKRRAYLRGVATAYRLASRKVAEQAQISAQEARKL